LPETAVNEIAAYLEAGGRPFHLHRPRPGNDAAGLAGERRLLPRRGQAPTGAWTGHAGDIALFG
jgi:hypothetical protein